MPLELRLSETVQPQVADGGPELMKHLSTSLTNFKHRSSPTVALTGHSPFFLDNLLMFQNWSCCIQRYGIWSRKSMRTEIVFGSQILGKPWAKRREKWEKEEDIEGFWAARGSASGYSLFWPGYLLVLIFSGLCYDASHLAVCAGWRDSNSGRAAAWVAVDRWWGRSSVLSSLCFPSIIFFPHPHPDSLGGGRESYLDLNMLKEQIKFAL